MQKVPFKLAGQINRAFFLIHLVATQLQLKVPVTIQ